MRSHVSVIFFAALAASGGCLAPAWTTRDSAEMAETRRIAAELEKKAYLPPGSSTLGGGRVLVRITALRMAEGERAPRLRYVRAGWRLSAAAVTKEAAAKITAQAAEDDVVSKSFVVEDGKSGSLGPAAEGEGGRPAVTFTAVRAAGRVTISFAAGDGGGLTLTVPEGRLAFVLPERGSTVEGPALELLSALSGGEAPADALLIDARPMR